MPSDVAIGPNGDIYIADMHHNRIRKVDARTRHHHDRGRQRPLGLLGRRRPGHRGARSPGPPGIAVVPDAHGKVTIFIADYYNGRVRAVGPDGIIRDVSDEGRDRVRRAVARGVRAEARAGCMSPTRATTRSSR